MKEALLNKPCWVIDILPEQVPGKRANRYFAVEKYFLQGRCLDEIKQKHINLILKLNCYRDVAIDEENEINPSPERIADEIRKRSLDHRDNAGNDQ